MGNYKIGVMLGDGIGPEIVKVTVNVLEAIGRLTGLKLQLKYFPVGLAAYEKYGSTLPTQTLYQKNKLVS